MLSSTSSTDLISHVASKTKSLAPRHPQSTERALPQYSHSGVTDNDERAKNRRGVEENPDSHHSDPLAMTTTADISPPLHYSISAVDQFDHFSRIKAVLTYSDRHGNWIGLKNFINLYFSTVFHAFFGEHVDMHLIHVETSKKFFAHFSLRAKRAYRVIIMLNYRLWDKILLSASALPDIYFQLPNRAYLEKAALLPMPPGSFYLGESEEQQTALSGSEALSASSSIASGRQATPDEATTPTNQWYDVSVAALCLVHRLEMIMFNDLRHNHASHVVTIGTFFANNNDVKNPFVVGKIYD